MPRQRDTKHRRNRRNKSRKMRGGKTFASSTPVKLAINDANGTPVPINCEICANNHYTETIGTLNKSKVRAGFGSIFLGEAAEFLDTTSIIIYFCNYCGHARIIRNNSTIRINAYVASPDEQLSPLRANTSSSAASPPPPPEGDNTQNLPPSPPPPPPAPANP